MRRQFQFDAARPYVPDENGFVVAAAYEEVAFGREGEGGDVVGVAEEGGGADWEVRYEWGPEEDAFVV